MTRTYNSPARAAAAQRTRDRLVEAALAIVLEEQDDTELTHKEVAERAGISLRTAYNHFPSREELLDAVDAAIAARLGRADTEVADPFALIENLYPFFERNADVIRTTRWRRAQRALGERRHARGRKLADQWAAEQLPQASRAERRELAALAHLFANSDTWMHLHDGFGLDAKSAVTLAHDVLRAELRRRRRASAKKSS